MMAREGGRHDDIEKVRRGREASNEAGLFEYIEFPISNCALRFPDRAALENELALIYGIGTATADRLRQADFTTLTTLEKHPRWGRAAAELRRIIASGDVARLARYGASQLQLLSFFQPETIGFVDIETTGLYAIHPLFLIGTLGFADGQGVIRQYLARNFDEERAVLYEAFQWIKKMELLVSFNGRCFDLPYLRNRMRFHRLAAEWDRFHLDLLHPARRRYRGRLPDCRLLTLEREVLGAVRENDIPGAQVAENYHRFLDSNDRAYLDPILRHNINDLMAMAELLGVLAMQEEG
jgi:uncharacterized protein YprB with RNaseH-like and TPR domain